MADLTTLQGWLVDAEGAKHRLLTGSLRASVSYNGENSVTFAKTDIDQLNAYIAALRSQIAGLSGDPTKSTKPIYFTF